MYIYIYMYAICSWKMVCHVHIYVHLRANPDRHESPEVTFYLHTMLLGPRKVGKDLPEII